MRILAFLFCLLFACAAQAQAPVANGSYVLPNGQRSDAYVQLCWNGSTLAVCGSGSSPVSGAPVACGASTSGTINTATTLIPAATATQHIMIQNNGSAAVLFSFTASTGLTATNAFTLAAGQSWSNVASFVPTTALTVQSGTASQPVMCEYK